MRWHPGESLQKLPAHRVDPGRVAVFNDGGEGAVEVEDPEGAETGADRFGWPRLHAETLLLRWFTVCNTNDLYDKRIIAEVVNNYTWRSGV
jgi:hypothetical protein